MEGVLYKRKDIITINVVGMIAGLAMALLSACLLFVKGLSGLDGVIAFLSLILFGLLGFTYCGITIYVNRRAYIHADDEGISAFCHNGFSLKCAMAEVAVVFYSGASLHIELESGKKYNILYVENAFQLGKFIQERVLQNHKKALDRGEIKIDISSLKRTRINETIGAVLMLLIFIAGVLCTAKLTGWKDAQEFSSGEVAIFIIMSLAGIVSILVAMVFLSRSIWHSRELEMKQITLNQLVLLTTPVRPGNAIKMYVDDVLYGKMRVTIYGYPNQDKVYFVAERINKDFDLACVYESGILANMDHALSQLMDMKEVPIPQIEGGEDKND